MKALTIKMNETTHYHSARLAELAKLRTYTRHMLVTLADKAYLKHKFSLPIEEGGLHPSLEPSSIASTGVELIRPLSQLYGIPVRRAIKLSRNGYPQMLYRLDVIYAVLVGFDTSLLMYKEIPEWMKDIHYDWENADETDTALMKKYQSLLDTEEANIHHFMLSNVRSDMFFLPFVHNVEEKLPVNPFEVLRPLYEEAIEFMAIVQPPDPNWTEMEEPFQYKV